MESRMSIITLGVKDMPLAIDFYKDGLGFPTNGTRDDGWIIFHTTGTRFSLFPKDQLARDIDAHLGASSHGFCGITLAHNVKERDDVDRVLKQAESCGGIIVKDAQIAEWGGYSGYFTDLDGYYWEVAWSDEWEFDDDGVLWGGSLGSPPLL